MFFFFYTWGYHHGHPAALLESGRVMSDLPSKTPQWSTWRSTALLGDLFLGKAASYSRDPERKMMRRKFESSVWNICKRWETKVSLNALTATTPAFGCQQSFWSSRVTHIRMSLIWLLAKDRRRYLKRYFIIIKLLNCYKSNTKMVY